MSYRIKLFTRIIICKTNLVKNIDHYLDYSFNYLLVCKNNYIKEY